ncbi:MAG: glycoside hydrolase family 2 TIM barrel-domain containing protein [bacterium]|nr:glycoside hydrolase family 2 TIM barrel-domain containing protein [bacterium]
MKKIKVLLWVWLQVIMFAATGQVIKVAVVQKGAGVFELQRGGMPYYVKGAGGSVHMDKVLECGGNSLRLWGAENAQEVLDEAQKNGLTVMLGLWMPPERHGFDYSDKWACEDQVAQFKSVVSKYKNHPALLMWGVGNEVDLEYTDFAVWNAVQNIAAMIHDEDKNHPTCVVTAGIDAPEVSLIKTYCKDIDILGVNTYGDLPSLPEKIRLFGWEKPYMVTEWGPNGHWEVAKTTWGAPIEQTSTEKAVTYRKRYRDFIKKDNNLCLGSYVFLWGQKQETTPTWYGVFIDNKQTEALNVLQEEWGGTKPTHWTPQILSFGLNQGAAITSVKVRKGANIQVDLAVKHEDPASLTYKWEILQESEFTKSGGDAEIRPEALAVMMKGNAQTGYSFKAPFQRGAYRLFVYIYDKHNQVACANFPFYVN